MNITVKSPLFGWTLYGKVARNCALQQRQL